jgi:cell division protein FtsW
MTTAIAKAARLKNKVGSSVAGRLGRSDQSALGRWFWEIDRVLLLLVIILISIGLIAVAAASPASAARYSGGNVTVAPLTYFWKQLMWVGMGVPIMIGVSMLAVREARRLAMAGAAFFSVMLALVPLIGVERNGATRWIGVGFSQFEPSEFLKPCFAVTLAWMLSLRAQDKTLPVVPLSFGLMAIFAFLLMKQPDFGQTVIFCSIWLAMIMMTGVSGRILSALVAAGVAAVALAYLFYETATRRIDGFLFAKGDSYQVDSASATLKAGGILGTGPGGGERKFHLPEAHTDYIFSVIGEEFGLIACLAIAAIYLTIIVRVCVKLLDEEDGFIVLAATGLAVQFTVQALINIAVNVNLAPSKGMTLPFISYGGSSMIALSLGMGLLLALTRRNPYLKRSPYVVKWNRQ